MGLGVRRHWGGGGGGIPARSGAVPAKNRRVGAGRAGGMDGTGSTWEQYSKQFFKLGDGQVGALVFRPFYRPNYAIFYTCTSYTRDMNYAF